MQTLSGMGNTTIESDGRELAWTLGGGYQPTARQRGMERILRELVAIRKQLSLMQTTGTFPAAHDNTSRTPPTPKPKGKTR